MNALMHMYVQCCILPKQRREDEAEEEQNKTSHVTPASPNISIPNNKQKQSSKNSRSREKVKKSGGNAAAS